jgi:CyaY protein
VPELSDADYDTLALRELEALLGAVDRIGEEIDAELASGVLSIEFVDGVRYVVNTQRAARQIWLAADRAAWHFDWRGDRSGWVSSKTGEELWATFERLMAKKLGRPVELSRPG